MIEESSSKKTLIRAFERMNELIKELAYIERITTQSFKPKLEEKSIDTLIEESLKLLLSNREKIEIISTKDIIKTDSRLLSLALKNLIDNAVKYAEDGKTKIIADNKSIKVISKGKSLENPLEYYLEPFTQEEKRQKGFGLGLYIVNNIIKHLKYKLNYQYKDGYNIFEITFI